ncbi:hypothetical protein EA138_11010 [Anoxybacillus flavithermus]|uniref:Mobile element protein n=1 Tax=Anoxybacillus flavithermus TaxID=33934 RepID=A0AAX1ZZE1_9BACL|nr:hypothetical protein EA138_11010 [Anoxybacillus flavithermus]
MCFCPNQGIPYLFSFVLVKCFTQNFIHHRIAASLIEENGKKRRNASFYKNVRFTFSQNELSFNLTVLMTFPLNAISIFSIC